MEFFKKGVVFISNSILYANLLVFLGACALTDIKFKKIPNKYVIIGGLEALFLGWMEKGPLMGTVYFLFRTILIFILFFPFYKYRKISAGDIKLLMVMAAFISVGPALICFVLGIYICLIPIILHFIKHRTLKNLKLPMAPSFMAGAVLCHIFKFIKI